MARRLFDNLLESGGAGQRKKKRAVSLPVSIGIHVAVLSAVILIPILMSSRELPEPALGAVSAFFVEPAPPPPPPPPPPPAASKPKTVTAPKVEQPQPVVEEEPKFTAPVETPKEVTKDEGIDTGMAEGVDEGVTGGVAGGTVGGVQGGTVGGMQGGTLGGAGNGEGGIGDMPAPAAPPNGPVSVGGKISEPRKTRNVPPVYPEMARHARVQGTVILEATISPQGRVMDLKVLRGIPLLDEAAMSAVRQWTYTPTMLNGTPVPVIMTVTVNFRLDGSTGGSSSAARAKPPKEEPKAAQAEQTHEPEPPPAAPAAPAPAPAPEAPAPAPAPEAPAPAPQPPAEQPAPEATPPS